MGKFIVRFTILFSAIYMILSFYAAQMMGVDILDDWYCVLFELCTVVYAHSEGKYHCRYIKHLALAVFASDVLTRIDNVYDVFTVEVHNLFPLSLLCLGFLATTVNAITHFIHVQKSHGRRNKTISD